jgi:hypothetical protein
MELYKIGLKKSSETHVRFVFHVYLITMRTPTKFYGMVSELIINNMIYIYFRITLCQSVRIYHSYLKLLTLYH